MNVTQIPAKMAGPALKALVNTLAIVFQVIMELIAKIILECVLPNPVKIKVIVRKRTSANIPAHV